jgi:phosphoserine phosphatase
MSLNNELQNRLKKVKMFVFDMDGTLIDGETINELAKVLGKEKEVERETEKAVHGNVPFGESLRKRVALLKGLSIKDVFDVASNISYMKGAKKTTKKLKEMNYKLAIATSGLMHIAEHVRRKLDFDFAFANELVVEEGILTGEIFGSLIEVKGKVEVIRKLCESMGISIKECAAVGDGANDVLLLQEVGVGFAFNAKEALLKAAEETPSIIVIPERDLSIILGHLKI